MSYSIDSALLQSLKAIEYDRKVITEITKLLVSQKRSLSSAELSFILIYYFELSDYNKAISFCSKMNINTTALTKAIKKDSLLPQADELILRRACALDVTIPSVIIMRYSDERIVFSKINDKVSVEFVSTDLDQTEASEVA